MKRITTHVGETTILQKNLNSALTELDQARTQQRNERNELSDAAKELAQARIDQAKSVNEARELQTKLDRVQQDLRDRDRQILDLQDELRTAKESVASLEADIVYADEQIAQLEDEIKRIESEVALHRETAENGNVGQVDEAVMKAHIDLYVNEYSLDLGAKGHDAVDKLLEISQLSNERICE